MSFAQAVEQGNSDQIGTGTRTWTKRRCRRILRCAIAISLLATHVAMAVDATYIYDANHRLVGVINTASSTRYVYDDAGNLLRTDSLSPSQLAILGFSPEHGAIGSSVGILGQGFSSTAASNLVKINGVSATVLTAGANQLQVTVPPGSTSGPISVTVGSNTDSTAVPFTVDGTGLAPSVTSVAPLGGFPGTLVTLNGTHLDPIAGATTVTLNGAPVVLSTETDTQLKFNTPKVFGSGKLTVTTPYGQSSATTDFFTYPSDYANGFTFLTGRMVVDGQVASTTLANSNVVGIQAFEATAGDWISLQGVTLPSTFNGAVDVYDPHGLRIGPQLFLEKTSPSLHLLQLPQSGTYTLAVWPDLKATYSITAKHDPVITTAAPYLFSTTVASASQRVVFMQPANHSFGLGITNAKSSMPGYGFTIIGTEAGGVELSRMYCQPSTTLKTCSVGYPAFAVDPQKAALPLPGWMQVVLASESGTTSSATVQLVADLSSVTSADASNTISFANPGQNAEQTLTLSAGQPLAFVVSSVVSTPAHEYIDVALYDPDGFKIFGNSASDSQAETFNIDPLAKSGTYTAYISPPDGAVGSLNYRILLSPQVSTTPNGVAAHVTTQAPNEDAYILFAATSGSAYTVNCTSTAEFVNFHVYRPDGSQVDSGGSCGSSSEADHVPSVPASGTYKVVVESDDPTMDAAVTVTSP